MHFYSYFSNFNSFITDAISHFAEIEVIPNTTLLVSFLHDIHLKFPILLYIYLRDLFIKSSLQKASKNEEI